MAEVVERVANLEARLDAQVVQLNGIQESVLRTEDRVERRFAAFEDKMERRFEAVDGAMARLEDRMDRRFDLMEKRFDVMEQRFLDLRTDFRWIMGGIAGATLAVIVTILGAAYAAYRF